MKDLICKALVCTEVEDDYFGIAIVFGMSKTKHCPTADTLNGRCLTTIISSFL